MIQSQLIHKLDYLFLSAFEVALHGTCLVCVQLPVMASGFLGREEGGIILRRMNRTDATATAAEQHLSSMKKEEKRPHVISVQYIAFVLVISAYSV